MMKNSTIVTAVLAIGLIVLISGSPGGTTLGADSGHEHSHSHGHAHSHAHTHDHGQSSAATQGNHPTAIRWGLLGLYSLLIASASLFGGWLPSRVKLSHVQFQFVISIVGGLILGIGVLHLLPHAVHEIGGNGLDAVAKWVLAGMVMMFFLLRAFHVHHHEPDVDFAVGGESADSPEASATTEETHANHEHGSHCNHSHAPQNGLSWVGIFFGLAVHTLLDGLALGATMQAEASHEGAAFVGLGIMLAIALHKPLDSLSITTLMINAGKPPRAYWIANILYATLCPIGAAAFLLGVGQMGSQGHFVVGCSLAFSAGVFICISLADLLPEMEFHSHHRIRLSIALLLGIALAWGIQFLEPAHLHQ